MIQTGTSCKCIIISPSGNLYGSEQVLLDFLTHCSRIYTVYVPERSLLLERLKVLNRHTLRTFDRNKLPILYARILRHLLFGKINTVYVNEGGHIRYIKILGALFPRKKFVVHLRMIYDAALSRVGEKQYENIRLVAISKYVAAGLAGPQRCSVLYDPYDFSSSSYKHSVETKKNNPLLQIGIVGRISATKGFHEFEALLKVLNQKEAGTFAFHFFGTPADDEAVKEGIARMMQSDCPVTFHGFSTREQIFSTVDMICHFCKEEGLGRVFLEAIHEGVPFVGFKKGGLPEIASLFGLETFMVELDEDKEWVNAYLDKLIDIYNRYEYYSLLVREQRGKNPASFSMSGYTRSLEEILL